MLKFARHGRCKGGLCSNFVLLHFILVFSISFLCSKMLEIISPELVEMIYVLTLYLCISSLYFSILFLCIKILEIILPELEEMRTAHLVSIGSESLCGLNAHCEAGYALLFKIHFLFHFVSIIFYCCFKLSIHENPSGLVQFHIFLHMMTHSMSASFILCAL